MSWQWDRAFLPCIWSGHPRIQVGLILREFREQQNLTQTELAERVDKKREYISKIENNSGNMTLKTLYDIVEKGLGGKVKISIEI